jgi:hypothetical protein
MIMEKLSIREASQTFGISRARLYQLLDKGIVAGHRSKKKGRGGDRGSMPLSLSRRKEGSRTNN